jgi:O-antigen/teichoic acid export membrane protein
MTEIQQEHSLKKRYFYKLGTNMLGFGMSLVTAGIVPRGLGPKAYGEYNFLTSFFLQIKGFLDMGVSVGFYNKLSQRQNENSLVSFYYHFIGIMSAVILSFVVFTQFTHISPKLWPDQKLTYVYLAAFFAIITWAAYGFDQIVDVYGLTVYSEVARLFQKFVGAVLLVTLFIFHDITLRNYFLYQYFNLALMAVVFIIIIHKKKHSILRSWALSYLQIKKYFYEFYHYSFPLFIESSIGLVAGLLDRWLLQVFAGSVQQGFYGLSFNIGAICFLFTGAMTPLIAREYAVAFGKNDMEGMSRLFRRYVPMLYSIAAYFACFIAIQADRVVYMLGGGSYKAAVAAVTIMAFYPVHQTYGQLSTTVITATGNTKLYRNVGIFASITGLILTYFLIAPARMFGLNAGATGLAVKMVFIQMLVVNIFLFYISRMLKISFAKYLGHQVLCMGALLAMGFLSTGAIDKILTFFAFNNAVAGFIASGLVYTSLAALAALYYPRLFGLKESDIPYLKKMIRSRMEGLFNGTGKA